MKDSRTKEDIYRKFQNPAREYRGTPFWSWNAEMTPEEVRRQVRELYEQGVGGFFIHSRDGLETPYLGREWMDCVEAAVDEAKQLGISAWLYDDDRWPSGNAGGMVAAGGEKVGEDFLIKGFPQPSNSSPSNSSPSNSTTQ